MVFTNEIAVLFYCVTMFTILLTSAFAILDRQREEASKRLRPGRCYDQVLKMLADEQGDWYIEKVLGHELAKILKHNTQDLEAVPGWEGPHGDDGDLGEDVDYDGDDRDDPAGEDDGEDGEDGEDSVDDGEEDDGEGDDGEEDDGEDDDGEDDDGEEDDGEDDGAEDDGEDDGAEDGEGDGEGDDGEGAGEDGAEDGAEDGGEDGGEDEITWTLTPPPHTTDLVLGGVCGVPSPSPKTMYVMGCI